MFIPYDIGQEVYVLDNLSSQIIATKITEIIVAENGIKIGTDFVGLGSSHHKIENVYPNRESIKEALLHVIVDRANNELSKL